jgi:hypothetical protein
MFQHIVEIRANDAFRVSMNGLLGQGRKARQGCACNRLHRLCQSLCPAQAAAWRSKDGDSLDLRQSPTWRQHPVTTDVRSDRTDCTQQAAADTASI